MLQQSQRLPSTEKWISKFFATLMHKQTCNAANIHSMSFQYEMKTLVIKLTLSFTENFFRSVPPVRAWFSGPPDWLEKKPLHHWYVRQKTKHPQWQQHLLAMPCMGEWSVCVCVCVQYLHLVNKTGNYILNQGCRNIPRCIISCLTQ